MYLYYLPMSPRTITFVVDFKTLIDMTLMIMGWQWIAILVVVLLLFGGKKIPELMQGLGKGMSAFKKGLNEVEEEMNKPVDEPKKLDK